MSAACTPAPKGSQGARQRGTGKHLMRKNAAHLAWIRTQPCCVAGCKSKQIEAHHVRTAANCGTGIKPPDNQAVPLCRSHHSAYHQHGRTSFEAAFGVDLGAALRRLVERRSYSPG